MLCKDCKYFEILYKPCKYVGAHTEPGRAYCNKHKLITDFFSHKKFDGLKCVVVKGGKNEM